MDIKEWFSQVLATFQLQEYLYLWSSYYQINPWTFSPPVHSVDSFFYPKKPSMSSAPVRIIPFSLQNVEMWKTKQRNSIVWFIPPLVLSQIHTVASKLADARYIPLGDQSTETERQKFNSPV